MARPDGIPQAVWDAAYYAAGSLYEPDSPAHGYATHVIARAILAERERGAIAAGNFLMTRTSLDVLRVVECEEAIREGHREPPEDEDCDGFSTDWSDGI